MTADLGWTSWSGGNLGDSDSPDPGDDTGALVLGAATTSEVTGNGDRGVYGGHDLTSYGALTDARAADSISIGDAGSVLTNAAGGSWTVGNSASGQGYSTIPAASFVNEGTFTKVGPDSVTFSGDFSFTNSGTLDVQAGVLGTGVVNDGIVEGSGEIAGDIANNGTLKPGSAGTGILTITGDYTQGAAGTLEIEINGTDPGSS